MTRLGATWRVLRRGGLARLRAVRDGAAAVRLGVAAAALTTGVLDALRDRPLDAVGLRAALGVTDAGLLGAWLRTLQAHGLVRESAGLWSLRPTARRLLDDDVLRAAYEAFAGYHTDLYRALPAQLHGGPARRDVLEQGETVARLSRAFEPFLHDALRRTVTDLRPESVLDVGCGAGANLVSMLAAAPDASGTGIEVDPTAADLAEALLRAEELSVRVAVLRGDVRELARRGQAGGPYDLALLANVVYYVPLADRVGLFRELAGLLSERGALLLVTTAAEPDPFSRHFDLLLRAQEGAMELPATRTLLAQLVEAGLRPEQVRRLAPGQPLVSVLARR